MAIFGKVVSTLSTADLQDLLAASAVENIRLEFKKEAPGRDETLKKLSSFANTYGGYLVVGAEANADGRLVSLPGVDLVPNYKQKIVQWCFDGTWPPVEAFVSDPLPSPQDASSYCYVIYVGESEEAPHFLNGRKGAYVRTDEFSQRFEARLATYDELQHLANRRSLLSQRRREILARAKARFVTLVETEYEDHPATTGNLGAHVVLTLSPLFPSRQLAEHEQLLAVLASNVNTG